MLVTHGIGYLPRVDRIVVLVDGAVSEVGSYQELIAQGGTFADFLTNYLIQDEEDEDDIDPEGRYFTAF